MPSKEIVFTVKLPLKSVWSFMIDRREVGCLFPGCKGVKLLNDLDSIWSLRFSFGPFTRSIEMKAHTTEMIENEHMSWTAVGEHIKTSGFVWVRRLSDDETEVTYRLEGHVTGHFSMLQDIVVSEKLSEITKAFMKNIKERLEGSGDK
jgi:carbon monoxide dehydrogenase subunit G